MRTGILPAGPGMSRSSMLASGPKGTGGNGCSRTIARAASTGSIYSGGAPAASISWSKNWVCGSSVIAVFLYTLIEYITGLTQSAIQPSAERYFIFFSVSVFALCERKTETQINGERHSSLVTCHLVILSSCHPVTPSPCHLVTPTLITRRFDETPACASHGRPARPPGSPCRAAPAPRTIFPASGHLPAQARRPATRLA